MISARKTPYGRNYGRTLSSSLSDVLAVDLGHVDALSTEQTLSWLASCLVDDKELGVYQLLSHPQSEDLLNQCLRLLGATIDSTRNGALAIISVVCSIDMGCRRLSDIITAQPSQSDVLTDLTALLLVSDQSQVADAMAILCALASSQQGRQWLLVKDQFDDTINVVCKLLKSGDTNIAAYSTMLVARLTTDEEGCARILNRRCCRRILVSMVHGLENSSTRVHAATGLGQLFRTDVGRVHILMLKESQQMIDAFFSLLVSNEESHQGVACFALNNLVASDPGLQRLLAHDNGIQFLTELVKLLNASSDKETLYHSAMIIRLVVKSKDGCYTVRGVDGFISELKVLGDIHRTDRRVQQEIQLALEYVKGIPTPSAPRCKGVTAHSADFEWDALALKCSLPQSYNLYVDGKIVYTGVECTHMVMDLKPYSSYSVKLQQLTDRDQSGHSSVVNVKTLETVPSMPKNFRTMTATTSQLKLGWESPEHQNGILLGYTIECRGKSLNMGQRETHCTFSNLAPATAYTYQLWTMTSVGRGETTTLKTQTASLGDFAPTNIGVHIVGKTEITLQWNPPKQTLGRINFYEATMDGKIIYSGVDRRCCLHQIKSGAEHSFTVSAWSSEGKCQSQPVVKRMPKHSDTGISVFSNKNKLHTAVKQKPRPKTTEAHHKHPATTHVNKQKLHSRTVQSQDKHVVSIPANKAAPTSSLRQHRDHPCGTAKKDNRNSNVVPDQTLTARQRISAAHGMTTRTQAANSNRTALPSTFKTRYSCPLPKMSTGLNRETRLQPTISIQTMTLPKQNDMTR